MRRASLFLSTVTAAVLPVAAEAQETRTGAVITATTGYSNSPFAESSGNNASGFVSLSIAPRATVQTERTTLNVTGLVHLQAYTNRYPLTDSYRLSMDLRNRASARLALFGHIDLATQVLGNDDQFGLVGTGGLIGPTGPIGSTGGLGSTVDTPIGGGTAGADSTGTDPATTPTTSPLVTDGALFDDIGLLGSRDRRRSIYGTAGGEYALSARDAVDFSGFVDLARYSRFGARSNYNGYGGTIGYSRRVSPTLRAGVQSSVSRFDYRGPQGRTDVVSVEGTLSGKLNQYWTFAASLGVSIIDASSPVTRNSTSASGSLQLCREAQRDVICVAGSRQARATGFNGAQYITSAALSWRHQLNERSRLSADAAYVQQGGLTTLNGTQNKYLRTAVTLDRDITERLRGLVSARYRRVFGGMTDRVNDYGGQIGISYRLGALR